LGLKFIPNRSIFASSMTRVTLLGCILMLAACAETGPPDLPPGSGFPRDANVDPRLRLTGSDRAQIARLVAAETSEPIRMVWRAGNPDKILVTTGPVDLTHPKSGAKGTGFMMQRTGSTWKVTGRPTINISPSFPSVEPVESAAGVRTY